MNYNLYEAVRTEVLSAPVTDCDVDLSNLSDEELYEAGTSVALERDRRRATAKDDQHVIEEVQRELARRQPARAQIAEMGRQLFLPGDPDGECPHCGAPLFKYNPESSLLRRAGVIRPVEDE